MLGNDKLRQAILKGGGGLGVFVFQSLGLEDENIGKAIVKDTQIRRDILDCPLGLTVIQTMAKKYPSVVDAIHSNPEIQQDILRDKDYGAKFLKEIIPSPSRHIKLPFGLTYNF
jgi:hypothetical protein